MFYPFPLGRCPERKYFASSWSKFFHLLVSNPASILSKSYRPDISPTELLQGLRRYDISLSRMLTGLNYKLPDGDICILIKVKKDYLWKQRTHKITKIRDSV